MLRATRLLSKGRRALSALSLLNVFPAIEVQLTAQVTASRSVRVFELYGRRCTECRYGYIY
jgi:hypothetical protein